jgi:hypothetical protein
MAAPEGAAWLAWRLEAIARMGRGEPVPEWRPEPAPLDDDRHRVDVGLIADPGELGAHARTTDGVSASNRWCHHGLLSSWS